MYFFYYKQWYKWCIFSYYKQCYKWCMLKWDSFSVGFWPGLPIPRNDTVNTESLSPRILNKGLDPPLAGTEETVSCLPA